MPTPSSTASSTTPIASISPATACDEPDQDQPQRIDPQLASRQNPPASRTPLKRATSCRNTERHDLGTTGRHRRNQQVGSRVKNLAEKIAAIRDRRERHKDMLAELDRTGESQISLTDPDSRAMAAHTHVAVGYNVQVAVDAKHKLIVEQQVTNQVVDMGLLTQTAEPAKEVLGVEKIAVVADRGYFKIEDIEACEKAGIEPYVPRPQRGPSVRAGLYRKDEFSYDAANDSFLCPAGQQLQAYSSSLLRGLKKINYVNKLACRDCAVRSFCTGNTFRTVSRLENEAVLERMQARLAKRPEILDRRRETVEHPFGTIKQWMNQGAFLMRGLEKVRAEFSLTALAYNLRRVLNIVEFTELMAALNA